jgi:alpha-tubulin suppressor-like RCC1 family protein
MQTRMRSVLVPTLAAHVAACSLLAPSDSRLLCQIDTSSDPQNCGACGRACEVGAVCASGVCVPPDGGPPPDGAPAPLGPVVAVACGGAFSCALFGGGGVRCWGANESGELGIGSDSALPTPIPGTVVTESGPLRTASALSLGARHACVVDNGGAVYCWGAGQQGQLGLGAGVTQSSVARAVAASGSPSFAAVGTGDLHTCAATTGGNVFCWGADHRRQVGVRPPVPSIPSPTQLSFTKPQMSLALGTAYTCAFAGAEKSAYCWGTNESGQLAQAAGQPVDVPTSAQVGGIASISAGGRFACAMPTGAGVECWGDNAAGELGHRTGTGGDVACATGPCNATPSAVAGLPAVKQVAAGGESACALAGDGSVWCWGADEHGQLGHGATDPERCTLDAGTGGCDSTPTKVQGVSGAKQIACGAGHCCAVLGTGAVVCWGASNSGQIGTTGGAGPNTVQGLK